MTAWGCPHEVDGKCLKIKGIRCDPGMKGCVLSGRVRFSVEAKNRPAKRGGDKVGEPQRRKGTKKE